MHVVIGPVAVDSALVWLAYAREVVADMEFLAEDGDVASEIVAVFRSYLTSWEEAAVGDVFLWETDVLPEHVEYHMHAFQKVAAELTDRAARTGISQAPKKGEEFYAALLHGVLFALSGEGSSHAEFARQLGEFWPGRRNLE